jgi:hypothetical protein
MFQFPAFAPYRLYIQRQVTGLLQTRFRIQKSPDRCLFASSPEHIAGYHVFRRFSMPRHPPHTLSSLTTFIDHRQHAQAHGLSCLQRSTGLVRQFVPRRKTNLRELTDNGSHIAKKVLDDTHPTEKLEHGVGITPHAGVGIASGNHASNTRPPPFRATNAV